jgi:thymidylate synthase
VSFDFTREWPFFPDDEKVRVYAPQANVAILIGHTEVEVGGVRKADPPLATLLEYLPDAIAPETLAAVGTIATLRDGVERVVQNLITNPHVSVLFLCGEDSPVFYPLEGLRCLYQYGVDEARHVLPGDGAVARAAKIFERDALATLSHDDIAVFRARPLDIVDCRGAVEPAALFAAVARELPPRVQPVAEPSWAFLDAIDVYRWRPRVLQVPPGQLDPAPGLGARRAGDTLVLERSGAAPVVATGKSDGRAQRALHTALRLGAIARAPGWEARLAAWTLAAERAVLAGAFPEDAARVGLDVPDGPAPAAAEQGRASPLRLDPNGFFKVRALYEAGILAADYHDAGGAHVETLHARGAEDLLAAIVAGDYLGDYPDRDQHVVYLGVQIGRADFALRTGLRFEEGQPLAGDARKNVDHHLSAGAVISGGSLEETWVAGLGNLREHGLLTATQKGRVAEGWCTFFVVPAMATIAIPRAYPANDEHIAHYAEELLRAAPEVRARGDYTYGDRTCHFFYDQIAATGAALAADPGRVCVNQRWVPEVDLPATAQHRPCLVFDLWFRHRGRLHTLQIARSHDIYGGLPQNALGVARGWGAALHAASGLPLGDLCFLSISNNFRVGDDAENVRKAIQGGAAPGAATPTLPLPVVAEVTPAALATALDAAAPLAAAYLPAVPTAAVGTPAEILAATPVLAERLLRYRGALDQVATVVERLRVERAQASRDRSNSLVLSPRDPRADRDAEATPLVCLQFRRQLDRLHAAAVVLGADGVALAPVLLDLQRAVATAAEVPVGSAMLVRVDPARTD